MCVVWIVAILLDSADVLLYILRPWTAVCKAVTPDTWRTENFMILAILCLFSGSIVFSMLIGAACVTALSMAEKLRRRNSNVIQGEKNREKEN